jgi:Uma2 family endonuclease
MAAVHELAQIFPQQGQWTERDYWALPETNHIVELSDGVLRVSPAPSHPHAHAVGRLFHELMTYVDRHALGEVLVAPYAVRLAPGRIREPDVLFVRREHMQRVGHRYATVPDWVAEVISPGSRTIDEREKRLEYAAAGVPEYWIVDPEARDGVVRVLRLRAGAGARKSAYDEVARYGLGETARAVSIPGFAIEVDRLLPREDHRAG